MWPRAGLLTVGLLIPYAAFRQHQLTIKRSRYGIRVFKTFFKTSGFYGVYLRVWGLLLLALLLGLMSFVGALIALAICPTLLSYLMATARNLTYNGTTIYTHGF